MSYYRCCKCQEVVPDNRIIFYKDAYSQKTMWECEACRILHQSKNI
jgi:hypothetical protein